MGGNKSKKRHCGVARKVSKFKKHSLTSGKIKTTVKKARNFNKNKSTATKVLP